VLEMSSDVWKRFPRNGSFNLGIKSHGERSGEHEGWCSTSQHRKWFFTLFAVWVVALSWRTMALLSGSGRLFLIAYYTYAPSHLPDLTKPIKMGILCAFINIFWTFITVTCLPPKN
jgi:hypothetical protein